MERETGLEPATSSLGSCASVKAPQRVSRPDVSGRRRFDWLLFLNKPRRGVGPHRHSGRFGGDIRWASIHLPSAESLFNGLYRPPNFTRFRATNRRWRLRKLGLMPANSLGTGTKRQ